LTEFAVVVCLFVYIPDDHLVEVETCELPNSATYACQPGPTNIRSHITTELITHRCTIINYFNKV